VGLVGVSLLRAVEQPWLVRWVLAGLMALFAGPAALGMLAGPQLHGIAAGPDEVLVKVGPRYFLFDHEGTFLYEVQLRVEVPESAELLGMGEDGVFWFSVTEKDADWNPVALTLLAFDASGTERFRHRLEGDWSAHLSTAGELYVGRVEAERLSLDLLDRETGRRSPHAQLPVNRALRILDLSSASAISWAVDGEGDVFLLTTAGARGLVTQYRPSGEAVDDWEVSPDPVTSVSYMKEVVLGRDGSVYVTHSSWEVSPSTENHGSVLKLDSPEHEGFRIKDGVGYLQDAAVSPGGDVFVTDLGREVKRFSPKGDLVLSWVAVPPRFGESWAEQSERVEQARWTKPDGDTEELIKAVVYGSWEASRRAAGWLLQRGASAMTQVTRAMLEFPESYLLRSAARDLWTAHPDEALALFEREGEDIRRLMAPTLAWEVDRPVPGLADVLTRMTLEGDERAGDALNHIGVTPEVVEARIADLRRRLREGESTVGVELDLEDSYASAIGELEVILFDPGDPDRDAFRALILEALRQYRPGLGDHERGEPLPPDVRARTEAWAMHEDEYVRDTAVLVLTGFGVEEHVDQALAAVRRNPELLPDALEAFIGLASVHPERANAVAQALARHALATVPTCCYGPDPLGTFARVPARRFVEISLQLVRDESLPLRRRSAILTWLPVTRIPRPVLLDLIGDQDWASGAARASSFTSFLEEVLREHPDDEEVKVTAKATLLALISSEPLAREGGGDGGACYGQGASLVFLLRALEALVAAEDLPYLAPLLDDPSLGERSRRQLLMVLARVPPNPELEKRLAPLLSDEDQAVLAAQALGRVGHPGALHVLVEDGLKRLGTYSWIQLDAGSFRPYGAEAEEALLSLMDYPNRGTQRAVRTLLAELESLEGVQQMRRELERALESGRLPAPGTLSALVRAGDDVVPKLVDLALASPGSLESLSLGESDERLADQIEATLMQESDPVRARILVRLLRAVCYRDLDQRLERVRDRHPVPAVRAAAAG
jgi:hypothetical protein